MRQYRPNARYPPGSLYQGKDTLLDDPHNLFLEHLFATGVLGLASFCMIWLYFYRLMYKQWSQMRRLATAIVSSMTGFMIQALFNPDVVALTTLFWLLLAMSTMSSNSCESKKAL